MKKNNVFMVTVVLVTIMLLATGCQKQQSYDNKYFLVTEDFLNGYGSKVTNVYVKSGKNLYAIGDATDVLTYNEYGVGIDFSERYGATGIYLPLSIGNGKVSETLSYGDIAPVVFSKKKDKLYSRERYESLSFSPAEFTEQTDYVTAMEKYGQMSDDYDNVSGCRCYHVLAEEVTILPSGEVADGGTIYDVSALEPGLYFVNDTYGIVEIIE